MKKIMTDAEEVVLTMQKIAADMELKSYEKIHDFVYSKDPVNCPSLTTFGRIFKKGGEKEASSFSFEKTLKPIYNALLDVDIDKDDDSIEDLGFKSLLRYKSDLLDKAQKRIDELNEEIKTIKQKERERYDKIIEEDRVKFHKSNAFAMEQIKLKDARIDELLAVNHENSATIKEVVNINNKLVSQLMNCPYTKNGIKE